jgi:glycosyltransferase involved in cell wall biosynthesis
MRICFMLPKILPAPNGAIAGGVINCTIGLALALCRKGVSVDVVAPISASAGTVLANHPVFPLLKGIKSVDRSMLVRGGAALFDLKREIERHHLERPYDVIHIHSGSYLYGMAVASRALQGVARVHSIYCPIVSEGQTVIERLGRTVLAGWASRNIDCIIGVTRNVCYSIREAKISEKKLSFIPMAVDTDEFAESREREQARLFKEGKTSVRLLFVGNASIEKGLEVLIDALEPLKKKGIDFQLIAALENQSRLSEFESRREMIGHKVKKLGLEGNVNITGVVNRIGELLRETHLLIVPFQDVASQRRVSDYPMALLEGMACGKCVVATPLRGVSEIVRNGVDGILSESFTSENLSKAMLHGIVHNDLRISLGIAARRTIEQKYSTDTIASQLIDLYRRLLSVRDM